jgi:hypothetical protein
LPEKLREKLLVAKLLLEKLLVNLRGRLSLGTDGFGLLEPASRAFPQSALVL